MKNKKTFTLVELIIVIAIIAILAVTAFLLLTKWLAKARDSSRASDLANLQTSLQIYLTESSKLPMPESYATISSSGTTLGYQGVFGESSKDSVGNISIAPKDPNDKEYYLYYVDATYKKYQIGAFNENEIAYNSNSVNAVDYSKRFFNTKGDKLGILLDTNQTPINQSLTGLDVSTGDVTYTAYFDNSNKLSGTGLTLQWLESVINNGGNGFDAPKECPIGFIPVPGNKDFNQPGFCVAKYEMKQKYGDAGSWNGVGGTLLTGTANNPYCTASAYCTNITGGLTGVIKGIESKPEGYPIVWINGYNSIQACNSMGAGYHLITNNERMTVARNIEANSVNWGYDKFDDQDQTKTYYGVNRGNGSFGGNDQFDGSIGALPATMGEQGYSGGVMQTGFLFKRTHTLSNGQIVWDFGANVREIVNGANTLDGNGYDKMYSNPCGNTSADRFSYTGHAASCNFTGGYTYNTVGPLTALYENNGAGMFYSPDVIAYDKVFLRGGGHWSAVNHAHGIFALYVGMLNTSAALHSGFRCAR